MKEDLDIFGVLISLCYLMEYHRLGALNNINLLLTVLESGQSKIKVSADSVPGESSLLYLIYIYI